MALSLIACLVAGCSDKSQEEANEKKPAAPEPTHGLTEEQSQRVLAKVGDTEITLGQFAERLANQSPYLRARYSNPERRREFLENMVRFELLATEARRKGYDETDEVLRLRKQVMVQQMMKAMFEERAEQSDISEQAIEDYYEAHRDEFHKPAQVRASHIQVGSRALAERLLKRLTAATDDATPKGSPGDDMARFRKLAKKHNQDPDTRDSLGDLRFLSRPENRESGEAAVPAAVVNAAFSLKNIGDVHPEVIESERGFHIVKLTGRREAMHRSLDQARRMIQSRLARERRERAVEQFVDELRKKADVKENLAMLDQVQVDAEAPATAQRPSEEE